MIKHSTIMKFISTSIAVCIIAMTAHAYLTPLSTVISGQGQFPNGTVGAPAMSFVNSSDAGFYRIGANDIGMAVAGLLGMEAKKATGAYVNYGFGGSASTSNSFLMLLERILAGSPIEVQISNPDNSAGAAAGFEAIVNSATDSFTFFSRSTATAAPAAYAGGGGFLRTAGGNLPGIRLIADDIATANIKFFAAGNGATDEIVRIHSTGLQLTTQNARPTCVVGIRGTLYFKQGGASVADEIDMCMKSSSDAYAWVVVTAAP